ncbi:Eco57I restriction-modification methylase domain-containing protein [Aliiglaciecola sp. 2_MG-2023]|uniref:Eco57I restriction-modification methylase domain-containing protein n=1 Tax=unclassified Aliiglaciecola TaxID=2593648 RepID=UPI0026E35E9A|nr:MULTISPECIES: Eco57I restriction-modification methylase domain-containing protein [unclassified Aliiglaciecola]MDO6709672.1 Eco57I restriction-modification methylase domain-containing protein [Aliiglaciecola sp. 2_MG-2023]MDO6750786.1 Eco57I restriction-modification methylase domain-containing protein [Aliiglaciecola sp. 1_MG-2023]
MTEAAVELTLPINDIVDSIRETANNKLDKATRGKLGQFMSTSAVSALLSSMFDDYSGDLSVLDAGAGVGSLTAAFLDNALRHNVNSISSTCYEISDILTPYLEETLSLCEERANLQATLFRSNIFTKDFIEDSVTAIKSPDFTPQYNRAILNPPYLKINAKSNERALLSSVNIETGNLYSAFVALAIKQLADGGELVAITPRSFCNGPYFNEFRRLLLDECSLNKIHVFNSRKSAFKADKVLQENVVFHLTKGTPQRETVIINSSACAEEHIPTVFEVNFDEVVQPNNSERFIHIITNTEEREIANKAGGLPCSLSDLGIQASTGKVVDFRTRDNLSYESVENSVPLIFPQHLRRSVLTWPLYGGKKPNALLLNESTQSLLVPNGTYIVTRRLTSKEETRRIIAAIYHPNTTDADVVAFENKTNYFHANGQPLDKSLAKGLWVFINSTIVDKYFRQMNGHTQVNATDLRTLRYPTYEQLIQIGKDFQCEEFNQVHADLVVSDVLNFN